MRVLLVYANSNRELVPSPPVGLSYVASATRAAGHDVRFLDLLFSRTPGRELRKAVRSFAPEVVGFSVRNIDNLVCQRVTRELDDLAGLLAVVREESQAPIVLGGPAISILGPRVLARLDADFAVVGEGEETLPRLLAALEAARGPGGLATPVFGNRRPTALAINGAEGKHQRSDVPGNETTGDSPTGHGTDGSEAGPGFAAVSGLCWRDREAIRSTPPAPLARFGRSGMAEWIDWPAYERAGGTWAIQSKRGCPLGCMYCAYSATEGHGLRRRSAADVVDEIEDAMTRISPRTFEIVDSTLNVPAEHAMEVCREIIRRRLKINLTAQGFNPLDVPDELFPLLKQAGFNAVMISPEAANDTMLSNLRKGFTMEHVRRTARLARASGISCFWFFMLGGPGETQATVDETVSFVERELTWKGSISLFMTGIRILPGTDLAHREIACGRLAADVDLSEPNFFLSPEVTEEWILNRINQAIGRHSNIAHAAEQGSSLLERLMDRALNAAGVAPPYWRFLPVMLSFSPLRLLRKHFPALVGGRR